MEALCGEGGQGGILISSISSKLEANSRFDDPESDPFLNGTHRQSSRIPKLSRDCRFALLRRGSSQEAALLAPSPLT